MDLAELKFVVKTEDLDDAAKKINALGVAVSKINRPIQEATKSTDNLNKKQAESSKAADTSAESTRKQTTVLERQQMILQFMTDGFSKGQASQLAYAKAAGALTTDIETLGQVLQTQRKLMGTDPFDKSMGALQSLRNEYTVIKEVQRLYNAELGLSKSQMQDLAKEKLRLIEKLKIEGASFTDVKNGIMELNAAYLKNANAENSITSALRNKEKATLDASRANQYIVKELERVNSLTASQGSITSATNNALIRFERALKMSGISAGEQVTKLEAYKQSLLSVQKAAGNRQVDYLSRALGPQITDIAVGLATGQAPLTILLQQGGQLRDQFALAGVAGKDMGDMLVTAGKSMVVSVKDIGAAIGQLVVKAFVGLGETIASSVTAPFKELANATKGVTSGTMSMSDALKGVLVSLSGLAKTGVVALVAILATLLIEYVKVTKANTELSKAISLTGASLGMTRDEAVSFAETLTSKTGGSTLKYISILTEFAKASADVDEEIIKLAGDMDKYLGQSIETTAQQYANLSESPTKALIKIAKEQGFVTEKTLQQVYALEEAGKKTEAATLASEAYKDSQANAVAEAKKNLDPLQTLWLDIKSAITQAGNAVYDLLKSSTVVATFRTVWETVAVIVSEVWYTITQTGKEIAGIGSQIAAVMRGDFSGAKSIGEKMKIDAEAARAAQEENVKAILNRNKAESQGSTISAAQAKANSQNAKSFEKRMEKQKEGLTYYQGMIKDIAKIEADAIAPTDGLNAAQKKMVDFLNDPKFMAQSQVVREKAMADLVSASATIEKNKAEKEYADVIRDIIKIESEATAGTYEFNAAQKEIVKLINDPKFMAQTEEKRKEAIARLTNASATIEEVKAQEILRKQNAEITKGFEDRLNKSYQAYFNAAEQSDQATKAVRMESEALDYQSSILLKTERERNKLLKVRQVEIDLEKEKAELDKQSVINAEYREELKADAAARAALKIQNINKSITYDDELARVQAYGQAFQNVFTGMADAIVDFAKTGKLNFKDLINSMITDLLRFELRKQATSMFEGFGGAAGIMKSVVQAFTGTPVSLNANGNVFGTSGIQAFAKGGAFTNTIVDSPTMFKFAKGTGLMGEAGPEAIMPLRRGADGSLGVAAAGGGSNVSVQVINNSTSQATTKETTDSKGNRRVEVVIGDMTAGEISRSGSASQKSIKSTFGLQPQLIRR